MTQPPTEGRFVHDFGRFKMVLDHADRDLAFQAEKFGWYLDEQLATQIFEDLARPGMRVLDIGANVGFYTLLAASKVGPSGRVVAVEPGPDNAALIRASLELNGYSNVTVAEAAATDRNGSTRLFLAPDYGSEHSLSGFSYSSGSVAEERTIDVRTVVVDDLLDEQLGDVAVDLVKMDIEGAESLALDGMTRLLAGNERLLLFTEFWPLGIQRGGHTPREFLERLTAAGFAIRHLDERLREAYPVSVDELLQIAAERTEAAAGPAGEGDALGERNWYTNLLCARGDGMPSFRAVLEAASSH